METVYSSETLVATYQTTRCHNPEHQTTNLHRREILNSHYYYYYHNMLSLVTGLFLLVRLLLNQR